MMCCYLNFHFQGQRVKYTFFFPLVSHKFFEIKGKGCLCARHEGMWRSGGVAPLILNLGTRTHQKCYAFLSFARFNITWDMTTLVTRVSTMTVQWYSGMTLYSVRQSVIPDFM